MGGGDRTKPTDWVQAVAALLAVILAAPALWVGLATYRDQVQVTRAQLESTQLEQRRYVERYAVRVSYWVEWMSVDGKDFLVVKVQNRSPVPITEIRIIVFGWDDDSGVQLEDQDVYPAREIAVPCSILTLRLQVQVEPDVFEDIQDLHHPFVTTLRFTDAVGRWEHPRTGYPSPIDAPRGLRPHEGTEPPIRFGWSGRFLASEVPGTRQSAGDCGEGG
ncbi:hypothetical protein OOJ91_12575 [Micromonospora lupini]|uniref:hypothetical protein n=1 Tax=Micromonospora lupini TaxID=285679 RepID=UPI0022501FF0|nr:hypothetical protein [Micromonospora lupini]MCX5066715.1 hypothetical protein [Micromonospora lupini]